MTVILYSLFWAVLGVYTTFVTGNVWFTGTLLLFAGMIEKFWLNLIFTTPPTVNDVLFSVSYPLTAFVGGFIVWLYQEVMNKDRKPIYNGIYSIDKMMTAQAFLYFAGWWGIIGAYWIYLAFAPTNYTAKILLYDVVILAIVGVVAWIDYYLYQRGIDEKKRIKRSIQSLQVLNSWVWNSHQKKEKVFG